MRILVFALLTASILGSLGSCGTRFVSPPDWRDDERNRRDPEKNRRHVERETIRLRWKTDVDRLGLLLIQVVPPITREWEYILSTTWQAEYDKSNELENGEDSQYYFELWDLDVKERLASSVYFNVTAPKKQNTRTVNAPPSTVTVSQTPPINAEAKSTTIKSTEEETKTAGDGETNISKSGTSRGEVAGAAVGGVVGGLLIAGAVSWVLWRRMAKRKSQAVDLTTVQNQERIVQTKAELPGDNSVHPSEYAKSPTGIYEAP